MLHLYKGEGKGKTTAAAGLALRSSFYGKKIVVFQFLKKTGAEFKVGEQSGLWKVYNFFSDFVITEEDFEKAKPIVEKGIQQLKYVMKNEKIGVLILDEILVCLSLGLINLDDIKFILEKKKDMEIIMTGRGNIKELEEEADLITEFKEIKHYFKSGTKARKGIEF